MQGDQIAGCTPQEAQLAVEALAGLHGPSWCDPTWLGLSSISMPKPGDEAAAKGLGEVCAMAADHSADVIFAVMPNVIKDQERTVRPTAQDWVIESQSLDGGMNIISPQPRVCVAVARLIREAVTANVHGHKAVVIG